MSKPTLRQSAARTGRSLLKLLLTPVGRRIPVGKNGAPHGIALLTVMLGLSLMSVVVTDLGYNEMIRYKLAIHDRDAMKADALTKSGLNLGRLVLSAQAAIQPLVSQLADSGIPLPAYTFWELIPLQSDLMRGLTNGELQGLVGLDVSQALADREEARREKMADAADEFDADKEGAGNGPFIPPAGGFGAFKGDFGVEIVDEERKAASLRGWSKEVNPQARFAYAQRLYNVIQPERYDFLFEDRDIYGERTDRYELVAHVYDWIDNNEDATDATGDAATWGRVAGGAEDGAYSSYKHPPKNAYFDSPRELMMVRGMSDAHWAAFGDNISIYAGSKINILSATDASVETLVRMCASNPQDPLLFDPQWTRAIVAAWGSCKQLGLLGGGCQVSTKGFVAFLQAGFQEIPGIAIDETRCLDSMTTESQNFTVRSSATVGAVTRTATAVLRVTGPTGEERYFYSID